MDDNQSFGSVDLQAGPQLNALIAEKVMGIKLGRCENTELEVVDGGMVCPKCLFGSTRSDDEEHNVVVSNYSIDISAAWQVVEFLRKAGFDFDCFSSSTRLQPGWTDVVLTSQVDEFSARAETFPLALCRAALLAVAK